MAYRLHISSQRAASILRCDAIYGCLTLNAGNAWLECYVFTVYLLYSVFTVSARLLLSQIITLGGNYATSACSSVFACVALISCLQ